jgi:hypothetical protein
MISPIALGKWKVTLVLLLLNLELKVHPPLLGIGKRHSSTKKKQHNSDWSESNRKYCRAEGRK